RYRCNDYSVPTTFGFRDVLVKGFVDEVVILCAGEEIARLRIPNQAGRVFRDEAGHRSGMKPDTVSINHRSLSTI
ncbi:hypothetical protein VSX63_25260, partial [Aurantimonas sp. C2-4-R8]|nr:hypothetical protein [Aurantimonas sp. C2-4-R8]